MYHRPYHIWLGSHLPLVTGLDYGLLGGNSLVLETSFGAPFNVFWGHIRYRINATSSRHLVILVFGPMTFLIGTSLSDRTRLRVKGLRRFNGSLEEVRLRVNSHRGLAAGSFLHRIRRSQLS